MTLQEPNRAQRYLIVSLGSAGRRHLRNLRALRPGAEIGVLRLGPGTDDRSIPEGADQLFVTVDQALAFEPTAAVVAGPASTRVALATTLADHGMHLLLEKPLGHDLSGVVPLLDLCRERRLTLMTGYNLRFSPSLREAKHLIESGFVGHILGARAEVGQYLPDWRPGGDYRKSVSATRSMGGGVLLELSHELDYILWLFGFPQRVTARGGTYSHLEIDVEDMVEIVLEYEAPRRLVCVHLDMVQRAPVRRCRFIGDLGTMIWDGYAQRIEYFRIEESEWRMLDQHASVDRNQSYLDELSHFLESIEHGTPPEADGYQASDVLAVVSAARTSIERGVAVEPRRHA